MFPLFVVISLIVQGSFATYNCDKCLWTKALGSKTCSKPNWWDPCLGCSTLGGGLGLSKFGGLSSGLCPSVASLGYGTSKYLPIFSASTSQVPVFKSYYKPIIKTHLTKIPIVEGKMKTLISKYPCLSKLYGIPSVSTLPLSKLSCLKSKLFQPSCSPYCTFC